MITGITTAHPPPPPLHKRSSPITGSLFYSSELEIFFVIMCNEYLTLLYDADQHNE